MNTNSDTNDQKSVNDFTKALTLATSALDNARTDLAAAYIQVLAARQERTGLFTPPGMTRWARSNSEALVDMRQISSVNIAGVGRRHLVGQGRGPAFFAFTLFLAWGQRPEESIRHYAAHARAEACVQRLIQEAQCL